MTVPDPEQPGVRWAYRYRNGRLEVSRTDGQRVKRWIVEYAFGSGHHATTFVNITDLVGPAILEHRLTFYTSDGVLAMTPGQRADLQIPGVKPYGREWYSTAARKCFGCHSTQLSARGEPVIDEATMIPSVACERCHGPGRSHVEAARQGAPAARLPMPFGAGGWTAESQMTLCGTCHRHPSRARPSQIRADDPQLARFQPVGIMQSRCYRESGGTFSCTTCHDPHARANPDRGQYNSVCLQCHDDGGLLRGRPPPGAQPVARPLPAGADCPVSPRGACVDCHMPRVDAGQRVLYTDHWIRVRHPGESTAPPRQPSHAGGLIDLNQFEPEP
jgi:predicted CXXCH cytochrome family protein